MASSSVSQESLDREDFEYNARRSRIRTMRSRAMPLHGRNDDGHERDQTIEHGGHSVNDGDAFSHGGVNTGACEHESPTRGPSSRAKDKRVRPSHLHKSKPAKDKRKLREKRRSTGVVHLMSPESTGDSLDEDDTETKRNTSLNEIVEHRTSPIEENGTKAYLSRSVRNKSPSDLEADLEDNQDYDSTVSQSETNLTIIGQSAQVPQGQTGLNKVTTNRFGNLSNHREEEDGHFNRPLVHRMTRSKEWDRESEKEHMMHIIPPRSVRTREFRDHGDSSSIRSQIGYTAPPTTHRQDHVEMKLMAKNKDLEQQLEREKEENARLRNILEERDITIAELQREIKLLHGDLVMADEDIDKLQSENRALLQAMAVLSTDC